jgi:hypothetical protein
MKIVLNAILVLLVCLAVGGGGCVLEKKVVEVLVTGETCVGYTEYETSADYTNPAVINYASQIDSILAKHDLDRNDIKRAVVRSASYVVTQFTQPTDWVISGEITVTRNDVPAGPYTVIEYTDQSVAEALNNTKKAKLKGDGVSLLNAALHDYIHNGAFPSITFTVVSGGVTPEPTPANPMIFSWQACIKLHIIFEEEVELPELL